MLVKRHIMSSCDNRVLPLIKPLNLQQTTSAKTTARRPLTPTRKFLSPEDAEKCFNFDASPPDKELVLKFLESQHLEAEAKKKRPKIALECMPIRSSSPSSVIPHSSRITSNIRRSAISQTLPPLKTRSRSNMSLTSIMEMEDTEEEPPTIDSGNGISVGISGSRSCPCSPLANRKSITKNSSGATMPMESADLSNRMMNSLESNRPTGSANLNVRDNFSPRNSFVLPEIKITEGP